MGEQIGSQIGQVQDVGIYEYPEKAKIVKVKILFDISNPIRAGIYIGNEVDGINWVDFRFENLPMFCFKCGLIGHNEENCYSTSPQIQSTNAGKTNPRGSWLRSRAYGHRILERKDKVFSSNPLKSLSGKQFSPILKGLIDTTAKLKIQQQQKEGRRDNPQPGSDSKMKQQAVYQNTTRSEIVLQTPNQITAQGSTDNDVLKRKHEAEQKNSSLGQKVSLDFTMAGLSKEASQSS